MKPFSYERAIDAQSAVLAVHGRPDAKFIAGGTNLIDLMKVRIETPTHLVDVNGLPMAGSRTPRMGACGSAHWSATARWRATAGSGNATRC
jgi:CO/xanthine dehydrogenase FAD-binding subunit